MAEIHGRRFDYRSDNKSFDLSWLFHYGCVCGHALGLTRNRKTVGRALLPDIHFAKG